jgi:phosphopantothenoylcysteine decarboxylase/phosphopantothenate--cysteine ligase
VTLGVTGGIAAYKSAEIVRLLRRRDLQVQVCMTQAATKLMSPHTLATLSEKPVALDLFDPALSPEYSEEPPGLIAAESRRRGIGHIQLSRSADLFLVAPATANILGKVAAGIADDLLSTAIMASSIPLLFAPAMNLLMWRSQAVQENLARLKQRGYQFIGPEVGELACGESGAGRMAAPEQIVDRTLRLLLGPEAGLGVLVTAGPTEEPVDAVRFLSNRSSGKMGVALAEAACRRGHRVTLIAGPLRCPAALGVERIDVTTAAEMEQAILERESQAEILIMAAAVADYRPQKPERGKIGSGATDLTLPLTPNPDILSRVAPARQKRGAVTVGFALEVGEGGEGRARQKLEQKGLDLIVLNDPTRPEAAFGGETTQVTILGPSGQTVPLPVQAKAAAAGEILRRAEALHKGSPRKGRQSG